MVRSSILLLSVLWISLVSPMMRSRISLIPPLATCVDSQPVLPLLDDAVKQISWSPALCELKVKRPLEEPRCETMRWSLSNFSYG